MSQEVCCVCLIVAQSMWFIMSYGIRACINRFWQYTEVGYLVEIYEGCSKSIGPLVGKNTIIYLDV